MNATAVKIPVSGLFFFFFLATNLTKSNISHTAFRGTEIIQMSTSFFLKIVFVYLRVREKERAEGGAGKEAVLPAEPEEGPDPWTPGS